MRSKEDITKEFNEVKIQKEHFENSVKACENRLAQLQGQFELLDQIEKEEIAKKTKPLKNKISEAL